MSNGKDRKMAPSWRSITSASSRVSSLKDYVGQRDYKSFFDRKEIRPGDGMNAAQGSTKQTWSQWAGEKIRRRNGSGSDLEQVILFPGWSTRRFHNGHGSRDEAEGAQFSLDVFVSGYASISRPPDSATRSQKAFMRVAKAFAALPKLPVADASASTAGNSSPIRLSPSTEDLLASIHLPPKPSEINEDFEVEALEHQFRHADDESASMSSSESDPPTPTTMTSRSFNSSGQPDLSDLHLLHANLYARLQPFWSSALPNRRVRLSVYTTPPQASAHPDAIDGDDPTSEPVATEDVLTSGQGAFQIKFNIPWERICKHPAASRVAFGHPDEELDVYILAELLPPPLPVQQQTSHHTSALHSPDPVVRSTLSIPITQSPVRLISDIDDTIKLSNILGGARAVFRNVFVKHLEELVIEGMGGWYMDMWKRGVRFHYVSNGPFELLPVISEFIKVSDLPQGSIKLKSYAGRSLFNGLMSAPANRKRDGLVEILSNFYDSQFILVGDTGEQDLEIYAELAAERHKQILAIFVRDASRPDVPALDDPTGQMIKQRNRSGAITPGSLLPADKNSQRHTAKPAFTAGLVASPTPGLPTPTQKDFFSTPKPGMPPPQHPPPQLSPLLRSSSTLISTARREQEYSTARAATSATPTNKPRKPVRSPSMPTPSSQSLGYFDIERQTPAAFTSASAGPGTPLPSPHTPSEMQGMSPTEKKRYELQMRVYKARMTIPSHIPLRIFKAPEECMEAKQILDTLERQHGSS